MKRPNERRCRERELCSELAQIAWLDQVGRRISRVGLVEDVSFEGMCLNLDLPAPVGATVQVRTQGLAGEARVCYCELGDYGYLVGLKFLEGSGWDRNTWHPRHLVTPSAIKA